MHGGQFSNSVRSVNRVRQGSPCVSVVSFEGLLVLGDEAGNVTFTDSDLRVSIQQKMIGGRIEFDTESDRPLFTRVLRRQISVHRASKTVACMPCTHFHRPFVVSCPHPGPAALLARSRQSPPLFVVAGPESGGAVVVKTWVGSKLANPANTLDINQLLKVRHISKHIVCRCTEALGTHLPKMPGLLHKPPYMICSCV